MISPRDFARALRKAADLIESGDVIVTRVTTERHDNGAIPGPAIVTLELTMPIRIAAEWTILEPAAIKPPELALEHQP